MLEHGAVPSMEPYIPAPEEAPQEPITIAVADDHPVFRDGLCELLRQEPGFEVVGKAANGREALALVEQHRPEILLLDLCMPAMDGLETLRAIRERRLPTKVIVVTASEDRDELLQAMQLGASGVVLKQDATGMLMKSIRRVHAGEIWLQSSTTQAVMRGRDPEPGIAPADLRPALLTRREMEVVRLVAQGLRNREIAARMLLSEQTVKNHLRAIFEKLHVGDRLELALYAIHHILER